MNDIWRQLPLDVIHLILYYLPNYVRSDMGYRVPRPLPICTLDIMRTLQTTHLKYHSLRTCKGYCSVMTIMVSQYGTFFVAVRGLNCFSYVI